eukprot:1703840-Pleurochrysis_carterae.AAC.1
MKPVHCHWLPNGAIIAYTWFTCKSTCSPIRLTMLLCKSSLREPMLQATVQKLGQKGFPRLGYLFGQGFSSLLSRWVA